MKQKKEYAPRVIALGTFDGVHLGHQELISRGKKWAEKHGCQLRVCTFDRHPLEILCPEKAPKLLTTPEEQAEKMKAAGAEEIQVIPFTRETAETEPEDFLAALRSECTLQAVVAGWNYTFGRKGRGNAELLEQDGKKHGYQVEIVPPVRTAAGEIISSTAIREKLVRGDAEGAREMLGSPYGITGTVVSGKHQGTRIGFPTANIRIAEKKLLPAYGVYICRLISGKECWNAVVNIGTQPTIPSGFVTVEAHALDTEIDLYGRLARVELLKHIRGEVRFQDVEALKAQICLDREAARTWFARQKEAGAKAENPFFPV